MLKTNSEIVHGDGETVEDGGVDGVGLEVDDVHLRADVLQSCFRTNRRDVRAHVAVRLVCDLNNSYSRNHFSTFFSNSENEIKAECGFSLE